MRFARRLFPTSMIAAAALFLLAAGPAAAAAPGESRFVPGEAIVRFEPVPAGVRAAALAGVDSQGGRSLAGLPGIRTVDLPPCEGVGAAVRELREAPGVAWAEPNYEASLARLPDDPRLDELWGMRNFGQEVAGVPGVPGVDIGAAAAWDLTTGGGVAVAVVDSGVDATHPDLAGHVDAARSRNFFPAANGAVAAGDWEDGNQHGTHVAGTIGASGNNGIGVAGVNWDGDLVSIRVCTISGACNVAAIAEGLAYAGALGARVANASLTAPFSFAIEAAVAAHPNTLYVAAAGNTGTNVDAEPVYPCALPNANVICVAAIDNRGGLADFSNRGAANVDLGAPGVEVLSTVPQLEAVFEGGELGVWSQDPAGRWTSPEADTIEFDDEALPLPASSTLTTTEPISLAGLRACRLEHLLALDTTSNEQFLQVEASGDGVKWTQVQTQPGGYSGTTEEKLIPATENLGAFDGEAAVRLRYRLLVSSSGQEEGALVAIQDPKVVCVGAQPAAGVYGSLSGTSMASPHVAGVAALAWSAFPGTSVAAMRAALLAGVVPTAALAGTTATGGRLDAAATLAALTPAPPSPEPAPVTKPGWAIGKQVAKRVTVSSAGRAKLRLRCRARQVKKCSGQVIVFAKRKANGKRVVLTSRSYQLAAGRTVNRAYWLRPRAFAQFRDRDLRAFRVRVVTGQPKLASKQRRVSTRKVGMRAMWR